MEPEPPGAAFLPGAGADPFWSEPETVSGPRTSGAGASSLPTVIFSFFPQVNCLYFINVRRLKKAIRKISKDSTTFCSSFGTISTGYGSFAALFVL